MNTKKYSLVILSIVLILLVFIGSASAADANETGVLAVDGSTNAVDEKIALDYSSEVSAASNDTNVLRNNGNDLLSMDNNVKSNELSDDTLKISNDELLTAGNSWYVNSSKTSSGDGSSDEKAFQTLKKALDKANRGDTIMIASGEYKGTDNIGLFIYYNLNFIKYGDDEAIFDAEGERRIWTFMEQHVNIIGLTFKNGKSTSNDGGAIYMRAGNVINCTFIDNTATTGYDGGAIYFLNEGNVSDCTFTGNTGRIGGAIYFSKEGNVSDCTFTGNNASIYAGAVSIINAGSVTNCNFTDNTAKEAGAIYFYDESSAINCNFINNTARQYGGAIVMNKGNVTNCNFTGNNASSDEGGAIRFLYYSNVTNCNFTDNTAGYMGGAITFFRGGSASNCTFTGNNATWWGGAIRFHDDGTVTDCAFVNNYAPYGKAISSGSALESVDNNWWGSNNPNWAELINKAGIPSSYAVLNGSADATTIKPGSKAKLTYGFYSNATGDLLSIPSRPIELSATGGHLDDDTGYLVNGEFSTEFSSEALGEFEITAAVDNQEVKLTETVAATVWYVNATAAPGGDGKSQATPFQTLKEALDVAEDYDTIMIAAGTYAGTNNRGLSIRNNISLEKYGEGEAIFDAEKSWRILNVYAGTINITGLTFKNGRSTYGGAIYFDNPVSNSNINAVFINNTADQGGAILFGGAFSNSIINATFINNSASREGGANYFASLSNVIIIGDFINNTLSKGSAGAGAYGGANYFNGYVENSNISGTYNHNTADRGGANYFNGYVENSNIDGAYTNNVATVYGGASYFSNPVTNSNISGTYNHNTAETGSGGANSIRTVTNSNISGTYTNNVANDNGGANYISLTVTYSNITGTYINNTAGKKSIIYIDAYSTAPTNVIISNAVFLNNNYDKTYGVIYAGKTGVTANDNWFGNNATDYDVEPKTTNVRMDNWLFLNATADPSEIGIGESSKITFKLQSYDGSDVSSYTGPIDIQLDLTQTLGELDKDTASLGEEIIYTAKQAGDGSVTATFETASYTINFDLDPRTPTEIKVTNSTLDLKIYGEVAAGATLTPADAGNLTYTSSNSSVAIVENGKIKALKEGKAIITVSFAGNDQYRPAVNKTIDVTVTLRDAKWTYIGLSGIEDDLDGASLYLPLNYVPDCFVRDADGMGLPAGTNITVFCEGNKNYTINTVTQENGLFNIDVSNVEPYQVYTVTFSADGYTAAIASVYVIKAPTVIDVANATVELKVKDEVAAGASLDPSEAGNLTYTSSNSSVAIVEDGKIVAVGEGSAIITVSFAGNDIYAAAQNKTISVTVSLRDANWTFINMITGKEEELDGAFLYLPWNYIPDCYVRDADGVGLPAGTNITIFCKDDGNFIISTITIINTNVQENGLFNVDVSNVKPDKTYSVSFSAEGYTTATATIRVVKAPTVIDVTNSTVDLKVNDEIATGATLTPADAGNLTYTSSNSSVAIVENGKIKAIGEGSATITVSFAGNNVYEAAENKTITVTVALRDASVTVDDDSMNLFIGGEGAIDAYPNPEGLNVNFKSNNESVVTVDANGKVTAVGLGKTTITVSVGGDGVYALNSTNVTVNVDKITTEILVDNETFDLKALENVSAGATLIPDAGNLIYYSSNTTVAVVQEGIIKALKKGIATITIRFEGNETHAAASKTIDVTVDVNDASVSVDNDTLDLLVKDTFNLVPTTVPEGLTVTYSSSNESVVMVKDNGEIYALDIGNATVTVSVGGDGVYALNTTEVKVTVKGSTEIIVENTTVDMKVGDDNVIVNATLIPDVAGELDFTSSDVSVVTVNGIGELTAVGAGTANITVSFGGNDKYAAAQNKTVTVTVTKIDTSISVTNTTVDMKVGDGAVIDAALTPVDAGELDFTSSDVSVVTVNGIGELTAVGAGTANITVSFGGNDKYAAAENKTITVSVYKLATEILIENKTLDLIVRDNVATGATLLPSEAGNLTYVSSNELVAKVVDGMIVAVGEGNATITVAFEGDYKYSAAESKTIDVTVKKTDSSIDIEPKVVELIVGEEATFTVVLPSDATGIVLVDVDGNKYYADVDAGNATVKLVGLTPGNFTADVVYPGDDKYTYASGSIDVKVADIILPQVSITVPEVKVGEEAKVIVELPEDATGTVTAIVDGKDVAAILVFGSPVALPLGELSAGNHSVVVIYSGNKIYDMGRDFKNFTVDKLSTNVTAEPVEIIEGETATITVVVDANATGLVLVDVGGNKCYGDVVSGKAVIDVAGLAAGNYTAKITYLGDSNFNSNLTSNDITVNEKAVSEITIDVPANFKTGENISISIPDATGNVSVIFNGVESIVPLVDGKANYTLPSITSGEYSIVVMYSGDDTHAPAYNATSVNVERLGSSFNVTEGTTFETYAVETAIGEKGALYAFVLRDSNGNPIANATVTFAYKTVVFNSTTDENGTLYLGISTYLAQDALCAMSYLGDETHDATFVAFNFKIQKKTTAIKGSAKTYKVKTKKKLFTVTLKTIKGSSRDGKIYLKKGKTLTLTVNGKTYTGKTNSKGQVTFKITNLNKKGKYVAVVKFAGSATYTSSKLKVKLTVK